MLDFLLGYIVGAASHGPATVAEAVNLSGTEKAVLAVSIVAIAVLLCAGMVRALKRSL